MTANPAPARWYEAVTAFTRHGWTKTQWHDLQAFFADTDQDGGPAIAYWLRNPPETFAAPITPTMVRDLFDQYGAPTDQVLNAIADGASERFCAAFLRPLVGLGHIAYVIAGWQFACDLGLSEPQATGWAATNYLGLIHPNYDESDEPESINTWTTRFGPTAYLYVLAGITPEEAVAMAETGTSPTEQQLRVMVALAGVVLPAGV